jgi:hypothetical protein
MCYDSDHLARRFIARDRLPSTDRNDTYGIIKTHAYTYTRTLVSRKRKMFVQCCFKKKKIVRPVFSPSPFGLFYVSRTRCTPKRITHTTSFFDIINAIYILFYSNDYPENGTYIRKRIQRTRLHGPPPAVCVTINLNVYVS